MILHFGRFTLDAAARQLTLDGREVRLPPKAFDLLLLLIERRPSVVDKATLRERLWPGTYVVEASLSNLVAEIRALTGGGGTALVRTVHGVGYAFAGVVEEVAEPAHEQERVPPPCWLIWRDRLLPLAPGKNLVGRDRGSAVWIDESGVSRRHARIRVPAGEEVGSAGVTIEDLNSTNGTFVRGRAVVAITPLADGDKVRIGPEVLVFRSRASTDAPTRRVKRPRHPPSDT
jgi:DNA-binding winged helix-turn-helix (wHTH) protein